MLKLNIVVFYHDLLNFKLLTILFGEEFFYEKGVDSMTIILATLIIVAHVIGHNSTEITATVAEFEEPEPHQSHSIFAN